MKKLCKLLTACTFAVMLLYAAPNSVAAAATAEKIPMNIDTYVNPIYQDLFVPEVRESDLTAAAFSGSVENDLTLETLTYNNAVKYVTKQMVARKNSISVSFTSSTGPSTIFSELINDCFAETSGSAPAAGDYLNYHWKSIGASGSTYIPSSSGYTYNFNLQVQYLSTAKQEEEVTKKVKSVLKSLNLDGKTHYEKISSVYKYITDHIRYDYDSLTYYEITGTIDGHEAAWTAYGGIVKGTCVCQGYASLFHRMMDELKISSRVITGDGGGGAHAWNIVKIGNLYYNLDATWDAYNPDSGIMKGRRDWFLLNNANFRQHTRDAQFSTAAFNKKYPMSKTNFKVSTVKYNINYKLNGGKNSSKNPKTYTKGTATITLKAPTRKGYTFKGWYSDSKFKKKVTQIKKGSTGSITLYAKWAKK